MFGVRLDSCRVEPPIPHPADRNFFRSVMQKHHVEPHVAATLSSEAEPNCGFIFARKSYSDGTWGDTVVASVFGEAEHCTSSDHT